MKKRLLLGLMLAGLVGCNNSALISDLDGAGGDAGPQVMTTITGTASYRERIMLPPHTELEVTVYDENGEVLSQNRTQAAGPPYRFSARVPEAAVLTPLTIQAKLYLDDQVRFASDNMPFSAGQPPFIILKGLQ